MLTDEQLMEKVRDGETKQLAVLFERYHRALYRYCMAIVGRAVAAEDCVQEAFRRVLHYRSSYRPGLNFRIWLYRIARNAAMDQVPDRAYAAVAENEDDAPGPEHVAITRQDAELLQQALMGIAPGYREVLALARFQDLRAREIAIVIGAEEGAVRVKLHRALRALTREFHRITTEHGYGYQEKST